MMGPRLARLLDIAGPAIAPTGPVAVVGPGRLAEEVTEVLTVRNGFVAFESALHVLPSGPTPPGIMDLQLWNDERLWRHKYQDLPEDMWFFAEDAFGGQFALLGRRVVAFDPETGEYHEVATSLEGWAGSLLMEPELLTGFPLAHEWQVRNGALPMGSRLVPKKPFVLGGEFTVDNLYLLDAAEGMRLRGELATQIRNLPDGAPVTFKIVP